MKSYRDLEIYSSSKSLAINDHKMTLQLPEFELYEEASQVRRSSKCITSMIVEGYGRRRYKAEYIRYLIFPQSECDETIVHLDFLFETGSFKDEVLFKDLRSKYELLSRQINKFIQWVEDNFTPPATGNQ